MPSRHKDFEAITITGYQIRDIRFPVLYVLIKGGVALMHNIDFFTRRGI